jgi:hypothetical protein
MTIDGPRLQLEPAVITLSRPGAAELNGTWELERGAVELNATLKQARWKELRTALAAFPDIDLPAGLEACEEGVLDGEVRFSRAGQVPAEAMETAAPAPARFTGLVRASALACRVAGISDPVEVAHATFTLAPPGWRMRASTGRLGPLAWRGEAAWEGGAQPVRFNLALDTLPLAALEQELQPLPGERANVLERTLRWRRPALPAWLAARHWEGRLQAAEIQLAGYKLARFAATLHWRGATLELSDMAARYDEAPVNAHATVKLSASGPHYEVHGTAEGIEWGDSGKVSGVFDIHASGRGAALLDTLKVTAQVNARQLEVAGEALEQPAVEIDYDAAREAQRLRLNALAAKAGGEWLTGTGGSTGDNRWRAELNGAARSIKVTGTFLPWRLDADHGAGARAR